jgi:hypothetical protein
MAQLSYWVGVENVENLGEAVATPSDPRRAHPLKALRQHGVAERDIVLETLPVFGLCQWHGAS